MSKSRSFLSNLSFTLGLNLLVKLFWVFGIEIAVQNALGTTAYGKYFEAFNFAFIFYIFLDLGISNYNNRMVAGDAAKLKDFFPLMLSMKMLLAILYLFVIYLAARLLNYDDQHRYLIMFLGLNQVLISMLLYLRSNIGALHLFRLDAVLSVLDRLIMGLICATLIWLPGWLGELSLQSFVWAQFIGYFCAVIIAGVNVVRQGVPFRFGWDKQAMAKILKGALPFALLFFLMSLYTRVDSIMLGRLLPDGSFQAGLYASAFRILDASLIFTVLLSNLLLPMFSRMIANNESVRSLVNESYRVVLVALTVLCGTAFFYAATIYPVLYKDNADSGALLFAMLMLNFAPMALGYIFGTLLTASGSMRLLNLVSSAGLLVNVIANAILIPIHGAFGAVVATLVTQSLVTLINFILSLQKFDLQLYDFIHWRVISYVLGSALLFGLPRMLGFNAHQLWWLVGGIAASLVLSVILGVFRLNEILSLMKVRQSEGANRSKD